MNSLIDQRNRYVSESQIVGACTNKLSNKASIFFLELKHLIAVIKLWRLRVAQRKQIASMPDHLLKDIGVSRYDANTEAVKHFWES